MTGANLVLPCKGLSTRITSHQHTTLSPTASLTGVPALASAYSSISANCLWYAVTLFAGQTVTVLQDIVTSTNGRQAR